MLLFQLSQPVSLEERSKNHKSNTVFFSCVVVFTPHADMKDGDRLFFLLICAIVKTYNVLSKTMLYQRGIACVLLHRDRRFHLQKPARVAVIETSKD